MFTTDVRYLKLGMFIDNKSLRSNARDTKMRTITKRTLKKCIPINITFVVDFNRHSSCILFKTRVRVKRDLKLLNYIHVMFQSGGWWNRRVQPPPPRFFLPFAPGSHFLPQ